MQNNQQKFFQTSKIRFKNNFCQKSNQISINSSSSEILTSKKSSIKSSDFDEMSFFNQKFKKIILIQNPETIRLEIEEIAKRLIKLKNQYNNEESTSSKIIKNIINTQRSTTSMGYYSSTNDSFDSNQLNNSIKEKKLIKSMELENFNQNLIENEPKTPLIKLDLSGLNSSSEPEENLQNNWSEIAIYPRQNSIKKTPDLIKKTPKKIIKSNSISSKSTTKSSKKKLPDWMRLLPDSFNGAPITTESRLLWLPSSSKILFIFLKILLTFF